MNTRIAPSPTGFFHLGTARTAYFNYLYTKATNGKFILRIDDTDSARSKQEYCDDIIDSLKWLGINWDEIHYQSQRQGVYGYFLQKLLISGRAKKQDDNSVIFSSSYPDFWTDKIIGKVFITQQDKEKQIILCRSDGSFTYHFASVVDDISLGINCIIRGSDHISNTAQQVSIYNALEYPLPDFFHLGLIHKGKNKGKLSKRDNDALFSVYKQYHPDAVKNFILRLGWSHPDPNFDKHTPLVPVDLAINIFLDGNFQSSASNLDLNKLKWYDKQYRKLNLNTNFS